MRGDAAGDPAASPSTTLGSTNAEALARARAGERGPLWVTAARQTAGRGRRGNVWTSEAGQSLRQPAADRSGAARAPAGTVLRGGARRPRRRDRGGAAACTALKLKWPNDLLLDGAKFAGILIEAESHGEPTAWPRGIGMNCAHHPSGLAYPATSSRGERRGGGAGERLPARSRARMVSRLAQWNRGAGFAAIRAEWLTACGRHRRRHRGAASRPRAVGQVRNARPHGAADAAPAGRQARGHHGRRGVRDPHPARSARDDARPFQGR